jgi:hypothetical protein
MSENDAADPRQTVVRRRSMERQLALAILGASIYLLLVGAAAVVAALLLLDETRSNDLSRVAALSLAAGALGASVRSLYEVMSRLEVGLWELADGTIVERSLRRGVRAREDYFVQRSRRPGGAPSVGYSQDPHEPTPGPRAEFRSEEERFRHLVDEEDRRALGLTTAEYAVLRAREREALEARGFGLLDLPLLILLPLLGAALGLVSFAGLVGGFLVASGSENPTYSPAGLAFVGALAGMFAPNFIASLARAADAIFGKTQISAGRIDEHSGDLK